MPLDLHTACFRGNLEAVRAALTRGEDVNRKDRGCTPLMNAVLHKKNSTVRLLLEQPALDLNLGDDNEGDTALHLAVIVDNVEGVRLLLADPRLDPNQKNNGGDTPVMWAMADRKVDALRELVAHPSVDLDTRDSVGWSLEEEARSR